MHELLNCNSSKILFTDGFGELSDYVKGLGKNILWVCDTNTSKMVRPLPEPNVVLDFGESTKKWDSVERILTVASENNFTKDCVFLALGGGVICDLTSFAASIYMRGCRLVLIPTSLLAMTDASIGGKNGVNFRNYKDHIGTFYSPEATLICVDCLRSLSSQAFGNGMAEIIKLSFLSENEELLKELVLNRQRILNKDIEELKKIIEMSITIKNQHVSNINDQDYALDLGHTFAHALESMKRMQIPHTQAVAWGVCKAAEASCELKLCTEHYRDSIRKVFTTYGFNVDYKINKGEWFEFKSYLMKDIKVCDDHNRYVLPTGQGKTDLQFVDDVIIMQCVINSLGI